MKKKSYDIKTNLNELDAHVVQAQEYDDLPELTDNIVARADVFIGNVLVRKGRGRPFSLNKKKAVSVRLDSDLLAAMQANGAGWQTQMNAVLRQYYGIQ